MDLSYQHRSPIVSLAKDAQLLQGWDATPLAAALPSRPWRRAGRSGSGGGWPHGHPGSVGEDRSRPIIKAAGLPWLPTTSNSAGTTGVSEASNEP
jgi:hypothetical protein